MNRNFTIMHYILAISFFITLFSAVVPSTFFSKEAIIENLEISFAMNSMEAMPSDLLHIARMLRREIWDFHFYSGLFTFTMVFLLIYEVKKSSMTELIRPKGFIIFITTFISIMFTTGMLLFFREGSKEIVEYKEFLMSIHYYSAYLLGFTVLTHVLLMIYKRVSK